MKSFVERVVGDIGDKRRWREYKSRVKALPANYRSAVEAVERYLMYFGAVEKSDDLISMFEDLVDLFEQAAVDGMSIRAIVGDDPVEFADTFLRNYSESQWIKRERTLLVEAIDIAAGDVRNV